MTAVASLPKPALREDGTRGDWQTAAYRAEVSVLADHAIVKHALTGAERLRDLVASGKARWVTEIRCPRTMFNDVECSADPEQRVPLNQTDTAGDLYLIPGLIAVEQLTLPADGLDPFVWPPASTVDIDAGWWLIRGDARNALPLAAALVRFALDHTARLAAGQMTAEESTGADGSPCFRVTLAKDIWPAVRTDRRLQIAGLIAACGLLPTSSLSENAENWDSPIAARLRDRIAEAGLPDWTHPEYDPAAVATLLEPFPRCADGDDAP